VLAGPPRVEQVASGAKAMWGVVNLADPTRASAWGWGGAALIGTLRRGQSQRFPYSGNDPL